MREFTLLEDELKQLGYSEIFGIGLWGKEIDGTMIDTNSGEFAKIYPHCDADNYDFVGFASKPNEIAPLISRSLNEKYFIDARTEYESKRNNHD